MSRLSVVVGQLGAPGADEIERNLAILGIRGAKFANDIESIRNTVIATRPDVLVCDTTKAVVKASEITRGIRNQEIGSNPFMVVVSLVEPTSKTDLAKTVDSGTDDLFVAPFTRDVFVRRMNELAWHRKKFVAVSSYIGPTRRSGNRPGRKTAEEFEVPNPVQATGTGVPREQQWKEIAIAAKQLNARKLNADVEMFRTLVHEILPSYESSKIDDDFRRRVQMLQGIIVEVDRRAKRLGFFTLSDLCMLAGNMVNDVAENPVPPNLKHLRTMPKFVEGFEAALNEVPRAVGNG
jgi:CheY-like chemotaxis protein